MNDGMEKPGAHREGTWVDGLEQAKLYTWEHSG